MATRRGGCLSAALFLVAVVGAHAPRGSRRLRGTPTANATRGPQALVHASAPRALAGDRRRLGYDIVELAKLTAADASSKNYFGFAVAIDGDTLVIGASCNWFICSATAGAVYILRTYDGGATYDQVAKLTAADAATNDRFGSSVAIDGDTVVVGADEYASGPGSAYVFRTTNGGATYGQVAKLTAADAASSDEFGVRVAINGGTVMVGSYRDDDSGTNSGSVYVFRATDGVAYSQVAKIKAADAAAGDNFGISVAIDGDTVVIRDGASTSRNPKNLENAFLVCLFQLCEDVPKGRHEAGIHLGSP